MAAKDDIEAAIGHLAKKLPQVTAYSGITALATAINELAEARAWMLDPAQSHGGGAPRVPE